MSFPENFVWGAAASSYQIEGAAQKDGRGLSVWDVFSHTPEKTFLGHHGNVACDHYHRYEEDVTLMQQIGLKGYRLSIAWPRILPNGTGQINQAGLDFYDRLIDALLKVGITPYVTLFHWDLPYELYTRGGWLNRDSAHWFADYATAVAGCLGDRVQHWMTINEPGVFTNVGHKDGRHAPGDQLSNRHILRIAHNVLRAHGKAVQAIRAASPVETQIGIAPDTDVLMPLPDADAKTIERVKAHYFEIKRPDDFFNVRFWLDPVIFGEYPAEGLAMWEDIMPPIHDGDMMDISQPTDFIGINQYRGQYVTLENNALQVLENPPEQPYTMIGWAIMPEILYWGPRFLYERYQKPLYITENGLSSMDWVSTDGKVHDLNRIDFTRRHLRHLERAIDDGVPVRGYFHWSVMDNFEWAAGYRERFGLIHVDYKTQARTLKESALWYRDVIASNGEILSTKP